MDLRRLVPALAAILLLPLVVAARPSSPGRANPRLVDACELLSVAEVTRELGERPRSIRGYHEPATKPILASCVWFIKRVYVGSPPRPLPFELTTQIQRYSTIAEATHWYHETRAYDGRICGTHGPVAQMGDEAHFCLDHVKARTGRYVQDTYTYHPKLSDAANRGRAERLARLIARRLRTYG